MSSRVEEDSSDLDEKILAIERTLGKEIYENVRDALKLWLQHLISERRKRTDAAAVSRSLCSTPEPSLPENLRIEGFKGSIVELACTNKGSRLLQVRLEESDEASIAEIFASVLRDPGPLYTDTYGTFVLQKLIMLGNDDHRAALAEAMSGKVHELAMDTVGSRLIQTLLTNALPHVQMALSSELYDCVIECSKHKHATFVIQFLLTDCFWAHEKLASILRPVLPELASDPAATYVVQAALSSCTEWLQSDMVENLIKNWIQTPVFGNICCEQSSCFVIQKMLHAADEMQKDAIVESLRPYMGLLAASKFGAFVFRALKKP